MMKKIVHLDQYFPTGEQTVQPVMLWSGGKRFIEPITKYASVGAEYFKTIEPVPGHSIVYVLAVSAWERYGENRNGDGFPDQPYKPLASPPWISEDEVLTKHYKSFEILGHNYRHHKNTDPEKSVGRVMKAFWNPTMYRVELLIDVDNVKAPDLAEKIAAGEYPPVSMGTKVPWDVCTLCGNKAPTRAQYCDHLRFQMRDVVNGVKIAALNPSCKFFDISWVIRPADPNAYMLKKVADEAYEIKYSGAAAGEYLDEMEERKLAAHKLAVIDKVVQGIPVDAKSENIDPMHLRNVCAMQSTAQGLSEKLPELPDDLLRRLASSFSLPEIFTSTLAMGMPLCTREVVKITIYRGMPGAPNMDGVADAAVEARQPLLDLFQEHPQMLDAFEKDLDIDSRHLNSKVAEMIGTGMEKRSGIYEYLRRKYIPGKYREEIAQATTPFSVTDPASGQKYTTNRWAAIQAHDEIAKTNLRKVIGGGAALGGAYGLISAGLRSKGLGKLNPLVAGTLGAVGLANWPSMGAHYMTDQGVPIPVLTELTKTSADSGFARSLALPLFGTLGVMALLGMDRKNRLAQGHVPGNPYEGPVRRGVDTLSSAASNYPLLFTGLGTLGLRAAGNTSAAKYLGENVVKPLFSRGKTQVKKIDETLRDWAGRTKQELNSNAATKISSDSVSLPELDMDKIAESLGEVLLANVRL
jgi:hypothetical protein